jgi:hypothetical protein
MSKRLLKYLVIILVLNASCNNSREERVTKRAFYYWKSVFRIDSIEKKTLADLRVRRLYVKFFDVVWNENSSSSIPVAKIRVDSSISYFLADNANELIPTIFITNETLQNTHEQKIGELSERIYKLYQGLGRNTGLARIRISEVQIDCDWTETTKNKYFELLAHLNILFAAVDTELSATIRLYQCKYRDKAGIPPVRKGLLMCYNMGNLKDPGNDGNSIIEAAELKKYISDLDNYPLPLDIAFPLFEWKVLIRQNAFGGILQNLPDSSLLDPLIARRDGNRFEILSDTVLFEYPLRKNDIIRTEKSNYTDILEVAKAISPKLKTSRFTISLFHLDSLILTKYKINELENIFNSLH